MISTTAPVRRPIPRTWDDLTPEWMTAALAARRPGVEVASATLVGSDDGNNRRARFDLTYRAGDGPTRVFVKAEGEHRAVHARNGNLFNEPDLFAADVPLPVDHPRVYGVVVDRDALDWAIVTEDVAARGADPRDATRPLTVDQAAQGLRGLARLHSAYWGFDGASHPALAWVQTWAPTPGFREGLARRTPEGLRRAGDTLPPELAAYDGAAVVEVWARYVATLARAPVTLLHGDTHVGNTYVLPGGDVGFLDWAVLRRGGWSQDVGHFLQGALTTQDRRAAERELVTAYRDALDVPDRPTAGEVWLRYRASTAYGLAIWLSTLGSDGYQRRDVSETLARRFATAFVDLDGAGALDELDA